jgi:hypothetical protein
MRKYLAVVFTAAALTPLLSGCVFSPKPSNKVPPPPPALPENTTPQLAIQRFVLAYEQKKATEYQGIFTGDFTYEFSNTTDPTLVQQYSTGWFKTDEKESSNHLFTGYTPPGGTTLPAATTIDINLATDIPTDDISSPDVRTHKVLPTRVDGSITVPQSGSEPLTYLITNNYNQFYLVRGDVAASENRNLDTTQPADSTHWYIYRWVDLSGSSPAPNSIRTASTSDRTTLTPATWGHVKASWH